MYDIAIIGTGPAGLSAAVTAKLRGKDIALFGSKDFSEKLGKAQLIKNYLGFPDASGADLAEAFRRHLEQMQVEITEERIRTVYALGDYFALEGKAKTEAKAVVLATGVSQAAALKGEEQFLGRGVSYCATCDGFFYKGKTVAVAADSAEYEGEVSYLAELAEKVLYFPKYGAENVAAAFGGNVKIVDDSLAEICGERKANLVKGKKGEYGVDGVFLMRDCVAASSLVPGLETDGKHVKVDLQMRTNLPGLFACGDVAGLPYQYIKSAGQGNSAALSAVEYLAKLGMNKSGTAD